MNSPFKQKFSANSPLTQKKEIAKKVSDNKKKELPQATKDSLQQKALKRGKPFFSVKHNVYVEGEDGVLTNTPVNTDNYEKIESPLKQRQLGNRGAYEATNTGDLIDESVHDESIYKSSNSGKISGMKYNVENISEIQKDKDGQFMVSLDDSEAITSGPSKTVSNYNQGQKAVRDTLRPAVGKKFYNPKYK